MKQKIFILLIGIVWACPWQTMAQANITASGGNGIGPGGAVSYSVGQVAYRQYVGVAGSVSEGVQQTYEIAELNLEANLDVFDCIIYPNPTLSGVRLVVRDSSYPEIHADLFDVAGKTVLTFPVLVEEHDIPMGHQPAGTYVLRLYSAKKMVKSFKIIKY